MYQRRMVPHSVRCGSRWRRREMTTIGGSNAGTCKWQNTDKQSKEIEFSLRKVFNSTEIKIRPVNFFSEAGNKPRLVQNSDSKTLATECCKTPSKTRRLLCGVLKHQRGVESVEELYICSALAPTKTYNRLNLGIFVKLARFVHSPCL